MVARVCTTNSEAQVETATASVLARLAPLARRAPDAARRTGVAPERGRDTDAARGPSGRAEAPDCAGAFAGRQRRRGLRRADRRSRGRVPGPGRSRPAEPSGCVDDVTRSFLHIALKAHCGHSAWVRGGSTAGLASPTIRNTVQQEPERVSNGGGATVRQFKPPRNKIVLYQ